MITPLELSTTAVDCLTMDVDIHWHTVGQLCLVWICIYRLSIFLQVYSYTYYFRSSIRSIQSRGRVERFFCVCFSFRWLHDSLRMRKSRVAIYYNIPTMVYCRTTRLRSFLSST